MPATKSPFPKAVVGRKAFGAAWLSRHRAPREPRLYPREVVFHFIAALALGLFAVGWAYRFPSTCLSFGIGGMLFSVIASAASAFALRKVWQATLTAQHRDPRRHVASLGMAFRLYFILLHLAVFAAAFILAGTILASFGWGIAPLSVSAGLLTIAALALLGATTAIGKNDLALLGWFSDPAGWPGFTRPFSETWLLASRLEAALSRDSDSRRDRSVQLLPRLLRACTEQRPQIFSPVDAADRSQWSNGAPRALLFRTRAELMARLRASVLPFLFGLLLGWLLLTLLHSVSGWRPPEHTPSSTSSPKTPPPKSSPQNKSKDKNPASADNKSGGGQGGKDSNQGGEKGGSSSKGGSGGAGDSQGPGGGSPGKDSSEAKGGGESGGKGGSSGQGNSAEKGGDNGQGTSGGGSGNSSSKQGGEKGSSSSKGGSGGVGDAQGSGGGSSKDSPEAKSSGESGGKSGSSGQGNSAEKGSGGQGSSGGRSGDSSSKQGAEKGGSPSKGGSGGVDDAQGAAGGSSGKDSPAAKGGGESSGKGGTPGPDKSAAKDSGGRESSGIEPGTNQPQPPRDQAGKAGEKAGASSAGTNAGSSGKGSSNAPQKGQGGAGQRTGGPAPAAGNEKGSSGGRGPGRSGTASSEAQPGTENGRPPAATSISGSQTGEENSPPPPPPGPRPLDAAQEIILDFPSETTTGGTPDLSGASRTQPGPTPEFGPVPATRPPPAAAKRVNSDSPLQATPNWIHERLRSPDRKP